MYKAFRTAASDTVIPFLTRYDSLRLQRLLHTCVVVADMETFDVRSKKKVSEIVFFGPCFYVTQRVDPRMPQTHAALLMVHTN